MKNLSETTIYTAIQKELSETREYSWNDHCSLAVIDSTFNAIASFLGKVKSKDNPVAVKITDVYGKFCFGAFVIFHKSEEEGTDEGSWTLNFTFDENDIEKGWKVYTMPEDAELFDELASFAFNMYGMHYRYIPKDDNSSACDGSPQDIICVIFDVIKKYMEANATIDPCLEITRCATLTAALADDGNVVIGFEPSPTLKQYVKDDANIK